MNAIKVFSGAGERLAQLRSRLGHWHLGVAIALCSAMNQAAAQVSDVNNLGGGNGVNTSANFSALTNLLQQFVTFMTGPFGKAVVVISIIAAFVTWVFAPREGIFGPLLRVVVAGVAVLNASAWMVQLGSATTIRL